MEKTAVEWLEKRFYFTKGQLIDIDFEQAKEMEKEQSKQEYIKGMKDANEVRIAQEKQDL